MFALRTSNEDLKKTFQIVAGIVPHRHALAILSNVLLERKGTQLAITATDFEIQVRTTTSAPEGEDGAVTIPAKKVVDILGALPNEAPLRLVCETGKMILTSGRSRFSLQSLPVDKFPLLTFGNEGAEAPVEVTLRQKDLRTILSKVSYAMAQQDVRFYMNGALLSFVDQEMRAVTTDGHRLAYQCWPLEKKIEKKTDVIMPRKAVVELIRLLEENEEPVTIHLSPKQAHFSFGRIDFISKLIDGLYPDYQAVFPESKFKVDMERDALLNALQRASILVNDKQRAVRYCLGKNLLKIIGTSTEQDEAEEEVPISSQAGEMEIGFNARYLMDILPHLKGPRLTHHFNEDYSRTMITDSDDNNYLCVVMPTRI